MYNKVIIKIIFYILLLCGEEVTKEKIENIVNDYIKCLSKFEFNIKRLSNALNYAFSNYNQLFDDTMVNQMYYILSDSLLNEDISNTIVRLYYENIDNSAYYSAALIHLYIINNINNIEFSFVVSELIMLKMKKTFLIPRNFVHNDYKKAILNKDFSLLVRSIFEMEYICDKKYPCKYSKTEIIIKIKNIKEDLKAKFNIRKLYLFGSFAKGKNNENSDIDFLVILDESLINIERLEQISLLKEYLSELFECSVDVLDFTFALKELGENEMEQIITLI